MTRRKKTLAGWPYKFLIMCRRGVEDIIWALPLLGVLRVRFPKARLEWMVDEQNLPLLQGRSDLDKTVLFPKAEVYKIFKPLRPFYKVFVVFVNFVLALRRRLYAASIDVEDTGTGRWLMRLAGVRLRIGRKGLFISRCLNNFRVPPDPDAERQHMVWQYLNLLSGWMDITEAPPAPGIVVPEEVEKEKSGMLTRLNLEPKKYVILHPGTQWASQQWTIEGYVQVAEHLKKEYDLTSLITWGVGGRGTAWDIESKSQGAAKVAPEMDMSLHAAFLKSCRMHISGDCAAMHMASAQDIPTVALFGPTDPALRGPFWGKSEVISRWPDAAKYARPKQRLRPCPLMQEVTAEDVIQAVDRLMEATGDNGKEQPLDATA